MSKKNDSSSRSKVGITSAIDNSQSNEANEDNITVSTGGPMVQEKSKIYGRDRKDVTLNDWQIAVNQAAYELCQKDIALIERKARETYIFKKKSGSRSKEAEQTSSKAKKIKLSSDDRKEQLKEISETLSLKESHIRTKQILISKAYSVKDYKQCDTLKTQLGTLFSEKSKLQAKAEQLLKKESKSTYYHNNEPEKINEKEPKS